jgi:hypothetical protein
MTENPWLSTQVAQWEHALALLRAEGWIARLTCPVAPVQIEGALPSGHGFHFRARHNGVSLRVWPQEKEGRGWQGEVEYAGAREAASYLPAADGLPILRDLCQQALRAMDDAG